MSGAMWLYVSMYGILWDGLLLVALQNPMPCILPLCLDYLHVCLSGIPKTFKDYMQPKGVNSLPGGCGERIGLSLQTTHTGSGGNNSSHRRSNRLVFFWQREGYHEYTSAEQNINPADMVGAETAQFVHTGRRWPFHSIVHPDWYIKEGWCWAPHLQVARGSTSLESFH